MSDPTDLTSKAVKDFLAEAEEILDQLCSDLGVMSDISEDGECNPDSLNSVFRGAHSLKGLAGMFGFSNVQELAHHLETLLDSLRLGKVRLGPDVMTLLMDSLEALGTLIRNLADGGGEDPDLGQLVARIDRAVSSSSESDSDSVLAALGLPASMINALTEYEEHRLLENVKKARSIYSVLASFSLATFDRDLAELTDALKRTGEVISTLPSVGTSIESSIDFEILFASAKGVDEIAVIVADANATVRVLGGKATGNAPAPAIQPDLDLQSDTEELVPLSVSPDAAMTAKSMATRIGPAALAHRASNAATPAGRNISGSSA